MKRKIMIEMIAIILVTFTNIAMADEYESLQQLVTFSHAESECKFEIGGAKPSWVNLEIKDPEGKITLNSFFLKKNDSTEWNVGLSGNDGYFCNFKGTLEKSKNEWVKEKKTFFAKAGHFNNFGKFRIEKKVGVIKNFLKSPMSRDGNKVTIIPIGILVNFPIANNGEAQGWVNYLLKKRQSNWDEVGGEINLSYSPIKKISGFNLGLTGKSQFFNSKVYLTGLRQRNELGVRIGYDSKIFSPYFIYQRVCGKPEKEFLSQAEIMGSKIAIRKIQSDFSYSHNYESGIKTTQCTTEHPAFKGKLGLSIRVQSACWMREKDKQIAVFYQLGVNRKEEYGKTNFYNDPINMSQTLELVPKFNDAKNVLDTPRKTTEMMGGISYKLSLKSSGEVYTEKKGDCWSQSALFSSILSKNGYESYVIYYAPFDRRKEHAFSVFKEGEYWHIFEYGERWVTNVPASTTIDKAAKRILVAYLSTGGIKRAIQPEQGEWIFFFWQKSTEKNFYDSMADGVNWGESFQFKKVSISPQRLGGLRDIDNSGWF